MKKIFALLLALACMTALLPIAAQAETDNLEALFNEGVHWLFPFSEPFAKNEIPGKFLCMKIRNEETFSDYLTHTYLDQTDEDGIRLQKTTGDLPAEELEAFLEKHFTSKDAVKNFLSADNPLFEDFSYADGVYHLEIIMTGGTDFYGHLPYYAGYKALGDNQYEVYHRLIDTEYFFPRDYTFPAEDEGTEFVCVTSEDTIVHAKIEDVALKSVISIENGTYSFTSYEKIDRADIPGDLDNDGWEESYLTAKYYGRGAVLQIPVKEIPYGTSIDILSPRDLSSVAPMYDGIIGEDFSTLDVFPLSVVSDEDEFNVNNFKPTMTLYLDLPEECTKPVLIQILDAGTDTAEIPGQVIDGKYVCQLPCFGTFVLAQDNRPAEPEVTVPDVTEPEATEPEATEPEATEPEATEPEATEPEATEPEATEPEATEPSGEAPAAKEEDAADLTWVWVVAAVVAVAAIAAAVIVILKKKK